MRNLTVVYALEEPPEMFAKSIFLAGPTPRSNVVGSWRDEALRLLEEAGYDGVVFVPEPRNGGWADEYVDQVSWEERYLHMADCILFWVPRDMATLPGLTTNDEWGFWKDSGKAVFGAPPRAQKVRYQQHYANELKVPHADSLEDTVKLALTMVGDGAYRSGGEREVPLHIWRTSSFQQWYAAMRATGNRLDHARQVWTFRVGAEREHLLFWALHVDIYIVAENRHKTNEVVLGRPDISAIVMYQRAEELDKSTIVLVREFRSTVRNVDGYVYENAGGSSFKERSNPLQLAANEVHEETGLAIPATRFRRHEARQVNAPMSTHLAHLFSVEITDSELARLRAYVNEAHGVAEDTERTFVQITTLGELRTVDVVDWATIGMVVQVLLA